MSLQEKWILKSCFALNTVRHEVKFPMTVSQIIGAKSEIVADKKHLLWLHWTTVRWAVVLANNPIISLTHVFCVYVWVFKCMHSFIETIAFVHCLKGQSWDVKPKRKLVIALLLRPPEKGMLILCMALRSLGWAGIPTYSLTTTIILDLLRNNEGPYLTWIQLSDSCQLMIRVILSLVHQSWMWDYHNCVCVHTL